MTRREAAEKVENFFLPPRNRHANIVANKKRTARETSTGTFEDNSKPRSRPGLFPKWDEDLDSQQVFHCLRTEHSSSWTNKTGETRTNKNRRSEKAGFKIFLR
jgi:hypothetical protein